MTEEFIRANFCEAGIADTFKELGFDDPCMGYYDLRNQFCFYGQDLLKDNYCVRVAAPTYWQAIQWLRGKGVRIIEMQEMDLGRPVYEVWEGGKLSCQHLLIHEAITYACE